jgi:subtilisin family serine protease
MRLFTILIFLTPIYLHADLIPPIKYPSPDRLMGVQFLHEQGLTGKGVRIAVIESKKGDSAIHQDLADNILKCSDIMDPEHGAHVTGIICANNTNKQRPGIAPNSKILYKTIDIDYLYKNAYCKVQVTSPWHFKNGTIEKGEILTIHGPTMQRTGSDDSFDYQYKYNDTKMIPYDIVTQKNDHEKAIYMNCQGQSFDEEEINSYDINSQGKILSIEYHGEYDDKLTLIFEEIMAEKIKIINLSKPMPLGPKSKESLKKFTDTGGIIVKAAGNKGDSLGGYSLELASGDYFHDYKVDAQFVTNYELPPTIQDHIIIVGNLNKSGETFYQDYDGRKASATAGKTANRFISAWGENILSTTGTEKKRTTMTGTSQATPMVTGVIALLQEKFTTCTPKQISDAMLETADFLWVDEDDVDPEGTLDISSKSFIKEHKKESLKYFGRGRLNAERAFDYLIKQGCIS